MGPASWAARTPEALPRVINLVYELDEALSNDMLETEKELYGELDGAVAELHAEMGASDENLREGLRYVLAGTVTVRVAGAILLAVGIFVGATAPVLGAVG